MATIYVSSPRVKRARGDGKHRAFSGVQPNPRASDDTMDPYRLASWTMVAAKLELRAARAPGQSTDVTHTRHHEAITIYDFAIS